MHGSSWGQASTLVTPPLPLQREETRGCIFFRVLNINVLGWDCRLLRRSKIGCHFTPTGPPPVLFRVSCEFPSLQQTISLQGVGHGIYNVRHKGIIRVWLSQQHQQRVQNRHQRYCWPPRATWRHLEQIKTYASIAVNIWMIWNGALKNNAHGLERKSKAFNEKKRNGGAT